MAPVAGPAALRNNTLRMRSSLTHTADSPLPQATTARPLDAPANSRFRTRLIAGLIALGGGGVLALAMTLEPDPRGFGTHEGLGLLPCGMILTSGIPCPTCGMTTAFALLMNGRPVAAFVAQPAGAAMCLATIGAFFVSGWCLVAGRTPRVRWERINAFRWMIGFGVVLTGGWAFKIAHVLLSDTPTQ